MNTFDAIFEKGIKKGMETGMEIGREEGKTKGKAEVVRNLIVKLGFTNEQAADVAAVSIEFVQKVRASLKKK